MEDTAEDPHGADPLFLPVLRSTPRVRTADTGTVLLLASGAGPGGSGTLLPASGAGPGGSEGRCGVEGALSGGPIPSVRPRFKTSSLDLQTLQWRNISVRRCCRIPGRPCSPSQLQTEKQPDRKQQQQQQTHQQ